MSARTAIAILPVGSTEVEICADGVTKVVTLHRPAEFTEPAYADEVLFRSGFRRTGEWRSRYYEDDNGDGFWAANLVVTR